MTAPETVDVIFRRWNSNHGIIALFPGLPGTNDPGSCLSYEHLGQHAAASVALTSAHTTPASESESAPLRRELEQIGYRLRVVKRATRRHEATRRAEIAKVSG
jgi:hypothetical protein